MDVHSIPGGLDKFEYKISSNVLKIVLPVEYAFTSGNRTASPGFGADEYEWTNDEARQEFKDAIRTQIQAVWQGAFDFYSVNKNGTAPDRTLSLLITVEERSSDLIWRIMEGRDPGDEINACYKRL